MSDSTPPPHLGLFTPAAYHRASESERIDLILNADRAFASGLCAILGIDFPIGDDILADRRARALLWEQLEARRERKMS
jgi:hypothetical protein